MWPVKTFAFRLAKPSTQKIPINTSRPSLQNLPKPQVFVNYIAGWTHSATFLCTTMRRIERQKLEKAQISAQTSPPLHQSTLIRHIFPTKDRNLQSVFRTLPPPF